MVRKTLTEIGVARVQAPRDSLRRRMDWDAVVPGLMLRTTANRAKSWVLVTRFRGKVVFVTLGKPPGVTLATARALAREGLKRVANGEHPRLHPPPTIEIEDATLFEQAAADFVERWAKPRNRTWKETERILERDVIPHWKGRRLEAIRRADVVALLDQIAADRPIMANRVLATIKKLFSWALDRGLVDGHPVAGLSPPSPERARDRVLSDAEVVALWKAWTAMGYPWGDAFKLLLLTAARRGELEAIAWTEVDASDRVWTVPATRVKVDRPHLVPLSEPALTLLRDLPRIEGCLFAFSTRGGKHIQDWSGAVTSATEASAVTGWRVHDLRRTARTNFSRIGIASDISERLLGHIIAGVRGAYDRHDYLDQKRDALERWGAHLTALVATP